MLLDGLLLVLLGALDAMLRREAATSPRHTTDKPKAATAAVVAVGKGCAADYHSCTGAHRCCNPASRCYTKFVNKSYAQCRPHGCVGTCGWECRVLSPGMRAGAIIKSLANAEYGVGAQNLSQAVAAMSAPLAPPADGKPPLGHSERLGNVIDSWYFAALGDDGGGGQSGVALLHLVALTCGMPTSFGRYLATQLARASSMGVEQRRAAAHEAGRHSSWGLYSYPTIRLLMPQLRHDLRSAMRRYAHAFDPSLAQQAYAGGERHLVVHYRLGDFVTNNWCIPPKALAAAAKPLSPTVVEIMDGGMRHLDQVDGTGKEPHRANRTRKEYALRYSATLQTDLEAELRAALPHAKIVRTPAASIDHDWFRIAHAPLLVTGAGSFAVTAAAATHAKEVRTPAADNLNFPNRAVREVEQLAPNWRTYAYDLRDMRG